MLVHHLPYDTICILPPEPELDQSGEVEHSVELVEQWQEYGCPTSEVHFRLENDFVVSISPLRREAGEADDSAKWNSKRLSTWTQNNTKCLKSPGRFSDIYVCMYVYIYIYMYIHICIYI